MHMNNRSNNTMTWSQLPEEIQVALSDDGTIETIEKIASKFGLSAMDTGFLTKICGKLMTGKLPPNQFIKSITDNVDIGNEKAMGLAVELNKELFSGMKEALEVVHGLHKPQKKTPVISPYPPNPPSSLEKTGDLPPPPPPPPAPKPAGSILEQKLGGTFRMEGEQSSHTRPEHPLLPPREIVPPPPAPTRPTGVDPYREIPQ